MLLILCLALIWAPVASYSVHFVVEGTSTLTGGQRIAAVYGSQVSSTAEFQFAVTLQNNDTVFSAANNQLGVQAEFDFKYFMPNYNNGSVTGSSENTAYFTSERVLLPEHAVIGHYSTRKAFWLTRITGGGTVSANTMSFNSATNGFNAPSTLALTPDPTGQVMALLDFEGSDYVAAFFTGTTTEQNKAYILGVSGSTPALVGTFDLASPAVRMQYGLAFIVKNKGNGDFKIGLGGITKASTTGEQLFEIYDVNPAANTWTLTAISKQSNWFGIFAVGDNLNNNDFIYTMLVDKNSINLADWSTATWYVTALKVSTFETQSNGAVLTSDVTSDPTVTAKVSTGNVVYRLYNLGTMNYILGVPYYAANSLRIWNKNFATFGQDTKAVYLPSNSPVTSATYAYGFFRYKSTGSFNFYYQQDQSNGPLFKARAVLCDSSSADYFNASSSQCIVRPSSTPSGYRQDDSRMFIEACSVSNCDTCPTSAATCTKCKSGYSKVDNTCIECSVTNCQTCTTPNVCSTCISPFTGAKCDKIQCDVTECQACAAANVCVTLSERQGLHQRTASSA
jgi:hypothetical protein